MNFGCIATGILQMIALNFHEAIWRKYQGWLQTSVIPSEVVRPVVQHEYYHNFFIFRNSAIYRQIMSKSRRTAVDGVSLAA